ncbi:hypothetical protein RB195_014761 [Necator americanus]|uniref:Reverse transcriptase domain-containing protein n=1 Tax=Necator americanus TaxID=51031 RepID=A0ABR1E1J1_NECAM
MNQRTTAAIRTPAGCTTQYEVVTGVRQGAVAGPFLFNFAIDIIMRRTVDQCPADIVSAPSGCPLTNLEYADDVIFAESSTKLQHVVNLVSKLAAAYGLRLRPDKCKQMWISSRPRTGIRVDGQPIELVAELCYLRCTLKNNGSYERDVQQKCAKATSAFNSLTNEMSVVDPHHQRSQAASLPIRNLPHHDVWIGDLGSTINGYGEA